MSVINQMLKGLDKGAQQQQAAVASSGAVIVAAPNRHNKVLMALVSSMVIFAALAGYLFVQKQSRAANVSVPHDIIVPVPVPVPVVSDHNGNVDEPVTVKRDIDKPVMAESSGMAVASANKAVAVVARVEKITPKAVKPTVETAPQTVTKHVELTKPDTDSNEQNSISIKTVTRTPKQQAQLYAKQAEAALLAGDKERAKTLFSKVLTFDKKHDLSREKLAALLYGEQRTQSAVNLLQDGLSISPEYTNFRLMLARIYLKNSNKQQAYYYLKPHQPAVQGNVDYYAILAGLAQSLDDLDTALVAYKKLTEYEPNRAKWWLGLGITADKAKQVELALNAYHTAQNMGQLSASSRNYINARITQLEKQ